MPDDIRPFRDAAHIYFARGWFPFPLPPAAKFPPPKGWTGYHAGYPSAADIQAWSDNGVGGDNIGLRMAPDQLAIDVDAYGDKLGAKTFAQALARLGPLPPTWSLTSRDDGMSGMQVFRVPPGRQWADVLGPGVEIIHWGHRYSVAAPSIHPDTGHRYVWRDPDWNIVAGPEASDVPALPAAWVNDLDRGPVDQVSLKAETTSAEATEYLAALPAGPVCDYMLKILDDAAVELAPQQSRHDAARNLSLRIVRAGDQGHHGTMIALETLDELFHDAFTDGDRHVTPDEYARMVNGAVAICREKPTPETRRHCCDNETELADEAFWSARPVLTHIHQSAQAATAAPWALLGACLARCVAATPHNVKLDNIIGPYGSLNLFIGLCGTSGSGKGTAVALSEEVIHFGEIHTVTIGSGEGIAHQYSKKTKEGVVRIRYNCLIEVNEVDSMTALGQRQGSTLLAELRKAWMGEQLGFAYADPAKALPVKRHQYRMGLVMGIQPGKAKALLEDADGGSPQRYVFLPTTDPTAPDNPAPAPEPIYWNRPLFLGTHGGKTLIEYPDVAVKAVRANRLARNRGQETKYDGHTLFARMKIAAALAILDGRTLVDELDWQLAGTVMAISTRERDKLEAHALTQAIEVSEKRGKAQAREKRK